jgi:hypothetical protein
MQTEFKHGTNIGKPHDMAVSNEKGIWIFGG